MPHKLTIKGNGITGRGYEVLLDDHPLSGVTTLELRMAVDGEPNRLYLELLVSEIDSQVQAEQVQP